MLIMKSQKSDLKLLIESLILKFVKLYLKLLTIDQRRIRTSFVGKRLKRIQYEWLHFKPYDIDEN